jgi:hypothetical protein
MVSKNQILIAIYQPKTRGPQLTAEWNEITAELPTVTGSILSKVVMRVVSCHVFCLAQDQIYIFRRFFIPAKRLLTF